MPSTDHTSAARVIHALTRHGIEADIACTGGNVHTLITRRHDTDTRPPITCGPIYAGGTLWFADLSIGRDDDSDDTDENITPADIKAATTTAHRLIAHRIAAAHQVPHSQHAAGALGTDESDHATT